jgi:adenylylsulfate reductase subunit A
MAPPEYQWGYCNMATAKGLFCAGDASGASSHKFSSGSHAEGRIAGKSAIKFIVENSDAPNVDDAQIQAWKHKILAPLLVFEENQELSTDPHTNPAYIRPKMFMFRLQKIMDEYAGGVSAQFKTSEKLLLKGLELLDFLKEDSVKLAAEDLHELMRCWENVHRMWQAEAHVRTILAREETRWPGYYFRSDTPKMLDDWKVFMNCKYDAATDQWEMIKRPIIELVTD